MGMMTYGCSNSEGSCCRGLRLTQEKTASPRGRRTASASCSTPTEQERANTFFMRSVSTALREVRSCCWRSVLFQRLGHATGVSCCINTSIQRQITIYGRYRWIKTENQTERNSQL